MAGRAYHRGVTDRGRPPVDASFACPFVALEDDRDARSDVPDPRHRCFAELRPAPRAIAHQQAYCLSSGFASCPTFIDWAQREAARVRPAGRSGDDAGLAAAGLAGTAAMAAAHGDEPGPGRGSAAEPPVDDQVWPRRPEREWASPPPWGADQEGAEPEPDLDDQDATAPPPFLADRGTSDRTGAGAGAEDRAAAAAAGAAAGGLAAGATAGATASHRPPQYPEPDLEVEEEIATRYAPDGRRSTDRRRDRSGGTAVGGPSWEAPRRYEAYPAIRSPRSMPSLSPLLLAVAALVIGALALFFIPPLLLGLGGSSSPTPTPGASASAGVASPTVAASPSAAPSTGPTTYSVKQGDTMTSIARAHGVDVNALIAANPQIKNPNSLSIGDQLTIPTPSPSVIAAASPSPSP
jgi:LysM domain